MIRAADRAEEAIPALSIAPMMNRTDRHFRRFFRAISRHALLYTEMLTAGAVLHGDRDRLLGHDPAERPLALQVGGDDPRALARCAAIAAERGFDEINLNVGCPSDRVQKGCFGAVLMARPGRVAEIVAAMRAASPLPVTVKHRLGIDDQDEWTDLLRFVDVVARAGCDRFVVHARKAWLAGLSPAENRSVPPLRRDLVHRLARERPALRFVVNGGIRSLGEVLAELRHVPSVMVGRAAWEDPFAFAAADRVLFGDAGPLPTRRTVLERVRDLLAEERDSVTRPLAVVRPLMNLARGVPGGRRFRRMLGERAAAGDRADAAIEAAIRVLPEGVLDEPPAVPDREDTTRIPG